MQDNFERGESEFSHKESLTLIEQMITAAKDEHNERGEGWLIWGWILFVTSIASIILIYVDRREYINTMWLAVLPMGGLLYYLYNLRNRKRFLVKTYISRLLDKIETGFFISLVVLIMSGNIIGIYHHQYAHYLFGYFYVLYAFWMFIHGSATRFTPLIFGAYFNWAAAIFIFFLNDFKYVMMVSALAILVGYIIPGYLLRNQDKKPVTH